MRTNTQNDPKVATLVASVNTFSKSRGKYEDLTVQIHPTFAKVFSYSGEEYTVLRNECTCPDHFYRQRVCRHITAVQSVVGMVKHW